MSYLARTHDLNLLVSRFSYYAKIFMFVAVFLPTLELKFIIIIVRTHILSYTGSASIPTKDELLTLDVPNFIISEIWQYVFEYAAPMKPVITQIKFPVRFYFLFLSYIFLFIFYRVILSHRLIAEHNPHTYIRFFLFIFLLSLSLFLFLN